MEPVTFVLFGATGDLAKRKIYPALYNLFVDGKLPEAFSLIGLGRREWTDEFFQSNIEQSLRQFSRREIQDQALMQSFIRKFRYTVLDIGRTDDYKKLLGIIEERESALQLPPNRMFYLSVGPEYFTTIASNIAESGLGSTAGWKRLVIEKPFGHDLQSARDLNEQLSKSFAEEEIFRIDHYLGKPMVQNLEVLESANPIIQALWSNRYIANVQITASETVGVEERAGYYDHVGAVRDMFQNHMLQMLMMLAIHLPHNSSPEDVRKHKKQVMEALIPLSKSEVSANVIRGQYTSGSIGGTPVKDYRSEPGIAASSVNDTYIAAKLQVDDYFWRGVPFYIRTGKRLHEKSTRIVVEFKEALHQASTAALGGAPNLLLIEINPNEGIMLQLNTKENGELKPVQIQLHESSKDIPEAYENLIYDALVGNPTFFAHWDEVELAWAWVQPILDAFQENLVPLASYEAGSNGPAEADALLAEDGFHWWFDSKENTETKRKDEEYAYQTGH
ncbi:glucose-6-phosphate dehydrogenase [Paenibacillus sp. JDR-2]|uniref:glucose-6-phosphate dehydrogenase n=1 Tax=Paenibacillus sp. (strain JDR-2) TaxID=324057 RepID=UPI0001667CBC|nr:glucose-6-phosphate dehydrogenase [Paenibacillus sp. JDR-2]ACT01348.1 glucose-6-phosphate 1-dehydrogenase [Paenibacillus sp. JDR-2]